MNLPKICKGQIQSLCNYLVMPIKYVFPDFEQYHYLLYLIMIYQNFGQITQKFQVVTLFFYLFILKSNFIIWISKSKNEILDNIFFMLFNNIHMLIKLQNDQGEITQNYPSGDTGFLFILTSNFLIWNSRIK